MLSNKMTFSLMRLITLLAFVFVAGDAFSAKKPFEITITGLTAVPGTLAVLIIESAHPIPLLTLGDGANVAANIKITAIDRNGFVLTQGIGDGSDIAPIIVIDALDYSMRTPKKRLLFVVITQQPATDDPTKGAIAKVVIEIPGGLATTDPTVLATDGTDTELNISKLVQHVITLTEAVDTTDVPKVVSIQRLRPISQAAVSAFQEERIAPEPFNVRIVLTGPPHGIDLAAAGNLVEVENGTVSNLVVGVPFKGVPQDETATDTVPQGGTATATTVTPGFLLPTSDDGLYRQYRVTITPHTKSADFDVKIRIKSFHDGGGVVRKTYLPPAFADSVFLPNGSDILTVPVKGAARNLKAGYRVTIPADWIIPADGYLIIARNIAGSEIEAGPGPAGAWRTDVTPRATHRTPAQMIYNVVEAATLPNLATQFQNGVVVDLESQHVGLVISEVMWGEDVSLNPSSNSQWIELYNPGAQYKTIADKDETPDINEALTLVFYAPNEFSAVSARDTAGITDRIGTLDAKGAYWNPAGKGQSGRSGTGEAESVAGRTGVATVPIVSMYRVIDATTGAADGQLAASWASSEGPKSANFDPLATGIRHGTPGTATDATDTPADTAADQKAKDDAAKAELDRIANTGTIPVDGQIYISEIMFAGGGILPQWIEIANGSKSEEVNLSGWRLTVDNAAADADVSVGATAKFTIPKGTTIAPSERHDPTGVNTPSTILVVTEAGRNNLDDPAAAGQVVNLWEDNEIERILVGVVKRRYTLLSDMAFMVTLAPPELEKTTPPAGETAAAKATRLAAESKAAAKRKEATDMIGNLGADGTAAWALPMSEDGRSSIIRRHVQVTRGPAEPEDGTMAGNWVLASDTSFAQPTHILASSYYGAQSDVGTPGFRAGGALPVELSQFRPVRDKETGAVVITWSTQSELNNAGFFIKRSQQRDGQFKVINATMILGAGTTSEKQFYTYTDTTAQPNVVYYYQIEDVSLDGNRQTLTRGIRLRGHVGAAGKATVLWGELKSTN